MSSNDPIKRLALTPNAIRVLEDAIERGLRGLPAFEAAATTGGARERRELADERARIVRAEAARGLPLVRWWRRCMTRSTSRSP
jgi:hypothetical protein